MNSIFKFIKNMSGARDNKGGRVQTIPDYNPPHDNGSNDMNQVMNNKELIETLRLLKREGISYSYIANKTNICKSTFYNYANREEFPYFMRESITKFINDNFSNIVGEHKENV